MKKKKAKTEKGVGVEQSNYKPKSSHPSEKTNHQRRSPIQFPFLPFSFTISFLSSLPYFRRFLDSFTLSSITMPGTLSDPIWIILLFFFFFALFPFLLLIAWSSCFFCVSGEFEDDERPRVFEPESSEDDRRRTRSKSLRKRAITASAKFSNTLRKQSSRVADCRFATISVHEVRDAGEEDSVNKFRQVLIATDLLPPRHDDYHTMLRYLNSCLTAESILDQSQSLESL